MQPIDCTLILHCELLDAVVSVRAAPIFVDFSDFSPDISSVPFAENDGLLYCC